MKLRSAAAGIGVVVLVAVCGAPAPATSEVNVNINIGPPAVVVAEPPEMIVVPRSMVYFAPGVAVDLFFFEGHWWTRKDRGWFRSRHYNGPWRVVPTRAVPVAVLRVPRDYRRSYGHHDRVPYGHLRKHWETRERDRRHRRGEWEDRREHRRDHDRDHDRDHGGRGGYR